MLCNPHAEIPGARTDIGDKRRALTTIDGGGNRSAAFGEDERSACERGRLLMKQASGVDNDRLASHGLGAAHSDHHVGAIVLVGGLLQERSGRGALDLLGTEIDVARVPSSRPGATQLTSVSGANATAMQRVRWMRPAFETAYAMDEPIGPSPATDATLTMRPWPCAFMMGATALMSALAPSD